MARRPVVIAAIVVAAILALVAAGPFLVPSTLLTAQVGDRIAALTGRTVTIGSSPTLSFYPRPAITVDDVSIAGSEGTGAGPLVAIARVRARLRLLPLLIGRVEFDEFVLTAPRVHLVSDQAGHPNWLLANSALAAAARDPANGRLGIGQLTVTNGTLLYDNLANASREEIDALNLEASWPSADTPATGHGTMTWRGENFEFNASVTQPLALLRGDASPVRFAVASTPLRLSFNGNALAAAGFSLDGDTTIATPSLRHTIEWLGTPMGTGSILGPASIKGTAVWTDRVLSFSQGAVELDGNSAAGTLALDLHDARPALRGTLAGDKLDFSPYIEAARADMNAAGPWLLAPAKLAFATALDADLRLSAEQAIAGALRVSKMGAALTLKNGALGLAMDEAQFYGGTLGLAVGARESSGQLDASAEITIADAPAGVALKDLAGVSALDGTTALTLSLAGKGRSWGELAQNATGTAALTIDDGSLAGFDLAALADDLRDPLAGPVQVAEQRTAFTSLKATATISEGALRTDDLTLSGPDFTLNLVGQGSLVGGAVEARGALHGKGETDPIVIGGTWNQPVISPAAEKAAPTPSQN